MKKSIGLLSVCLLAAGVAQADVIIDDNFSSGSFSTDTRIRYNQIDAGWYKFSGTPGTSDWAISGGVLTNPGTTAGMPSEGSASRLVSTSGFSTDNTQITVSFDYTVGTGSTLYFHLTGWTQNGTPDANEDLANSSALNGAIQNNGETDFGDMNIIDGTDATGAAASAVALTGSGTYTATFDLTGYSWDAAEAPGLTGSIANVTDFDFIMAAFANNVTTTDGTGAISIDNMLITAIPEPGTIGMLGLGAIITFLIRRQTRS
jgi:hypothetical protein